MAELSADGEKVITLQFSMAGRTSHDEEPALRLDGLKPRRCKTLHEDAALACVLRPKPLVVRGKTLIRVVCPRQGCRYGLQRVAVNMTAAESQDHISLTCCEGVHVEY